ncbi:TPA: hypothetical protein ENS27_16575 [bacterium]|nr:hypothetical protein [bacterium]
MGLLLSAQTDTIVPFTSVITKKYPDNKTIQSIETYSIINGKYVENGLFIKYWPNGKVMDSVVFKNGIIVGERKAYNKNGKLWLSEYYEGDTFPRKIYSKVYNYSRLSKCRYIEYQITVYDPYERRKDEIVRYLRKDGSIIDSVYKQNNEIVYWVRYNKKGKLMFEQRK